MDINIAALLSLVAGVFIAIITCYAYVHNRYDNLNKDFQKKIDDLNKTVNTLQQSHIELSHKDELQQQVLDNLPSIYAIVNKLIDKQRGDGNGQ